MPGTEQKSCQTRSSVSKAPRSAYLKQVFINCPFDEEYWGMFQAIVFVIHACGLTPRCALEADDAAEERLAKIIRIIHECRLGIHDLSRKGVDTSSGMARFNMPYEMGLFQGACSFGSKKKAMLVMEAVPFDYQRFISDISGRDINHHGNDTRRAIVLIRNWLNAQRIVAPLPGGRALQALFDQFQRDLPECLTNAQLDASEVGFPHFINWSYVVAKWLGERDKV